MVGLGQNTATTGLLSLPSENPKCSESGSFKQERSDPVDDERYLAAKMPKRVGDFGFKSNEQMLSFSSSATPEFGFLTGKDVGLIQGKDAQNIALSYYRQSAHPRCSAGFESGNLNGGIHGSLTGVKGTFTPAQWIELEHQAMIYKYISANVPVPAHLLIPIRKALSSAGFPGFSVGSYPAHSLDGWGSFHLGFGFSGSTDPEPGRCRRTDGKKWRCSRDAVPDQKYCEKHINRGRHRSRKPVEGQTGQAASGSSASSKVAPAISNLMPPFMTSSGSASSSIGIAEHQIKGLQPAAATNSIIGTISNRLNDPQGLSVLHPTINLKSEDSPFSIRGQHGDSLQSEYGLVSNDSLLNLSEKRSYLSRKSHNSLLEFESQQVQHQGTPTPLMVERPKDQSNCAGIPWPQELKSDWTVLSMSNPMLSDF